MPRGRPTTMPAKISSDMPLPMPRSVICSPSHMMKAVPAVRVMTHSGTKLAARNGDHVLPDGAGQRERDGKGLDDAQQNGDVAGPLGDLAAAEFAFLLQLGQRLIDDGKQLEDDRRRDVRHDAEREDGELAQIAAGEEIGQAER